MKERNKDMIVANTKLVIVGAHNPGEESMRVFGRTLKLGDDSAGHRTIEFSEIPERPVRELDGPGHHSPSRFFASRSGTTRPSLMSNRASRRPTRNACV